MTENRLKLVYDCLRSINKQCLAKLREAEENKLPEKNIEYERGRVYEIGYALECVERIIFSE